MRINTGEDIDPSRIIDISMELNEKTVVWKDDEPPRLQALARIPQAPVNFTWLSFGSHAGTHIDAPYYLFNDRWTADQIPFDRLIGRCQVLDLTGVDDMITAKELMKKDIRQKIILLKTKNSDDLMEAFNPSHVAMDESAAQYLIDKGVLTLGFDYQSFERGGKCDIHRMFLERSITLIDNLRLKHASAKEYELICLPVKVTGIDGAPARAILLEDE
jgi:arylformamidase